MALSAVQIGNMALSHIGHRSTIESFDEASAEAKQVKLWYDRARLEALEAFDWSFARKRQALAAHTDDPPAGVWGYRYQYPADCLRARYLVNPSGPDADLVPFEVETSPDGATLSILTDLTEATLIYTFPQANVLLFSSLFVSALSHLLAYYVAFSITTKKAIKDQELLNFSNTVRVAAAGGANESASKPPREAPWVSGR